MKLLLIEFISAFGVSEQQLKGDISICALPVPLDPVAAADAGQNSIRRSTELYLGNRK